MLDELKLQLRKLKLEYEAKIKKLKRIFALKNNPYQIDDIIVDHSHTIKIKKIFVYGTSCLYTGVQLKKDLTPCKRQTDITMYQVNVKKLVRKGN